MTRRRTNAGARAQSTPEIAKLLEQYGCGPIQFTGTADALYERHLLFDNVVDPAAVGLRERYEAVAGRPWASRRSAGLAWGVGACVAVASPYRLPPWPPGSA
jgi:hypothetical protein